MIWTRVASDACLGYYGAMAITVKRSAANGRFIGKGSRSVEMLRGANGETVLMVNRSLAASALNQAMILPHRLPPDTYTQVKK